MTITPTRHNLFYIGWSKQSSFGTPVAPTQFWRWLDSTQAQPDMKLAEEREGDTSPWVSLVYKTQQYYMFKIVEYVRPITAGCALQALLGTGSDTYTAPTVNTTLAASALAGATTIQLTADQGNTGTKVLNLTPGYANSAYEVVTIDCTTRTTPNYTYTLASGATLKNAHTNGDAVTSVSTHAFTRQLLTYDPYTIEFAFSQASYGKAFRITDCVCVDLNITHEAKKPLKFEHTWYGSLMALPGSLLTPSYEGTSVIGNAGSPFTWWMANGNWKIDNLTTGNATSITKQTLQIKNTTTPDDLQSEAVTIPYWLPGNIDVSGTVDFHFQNYNQYQEVYYGTTGGTADSNLVGTGQLSTTWTADGVNGFTESLPYINYKSGPLQPKLDGKPLVMSLAFAPSRNPTNTTPMTLTLTNSQASVY